MYRVENLCGGYLSERNLRAACEIACNSWDHTPYVHSRRGKRPVVEYPADNVYGCDYALGHWGEPHADFVERLRAEGYTV